MGRVSPSHSCHRAPDRTVAWQHTVCPGLLHMSESDHIGDAFPPECGKKSWAPRSSVRSSVVNRPVHRAQAPCLCHWGPTGICHLTADRSGAAGSRAQEARPGPRVWVCVEAHTPSRGKPGMQGDPSGADDGSPQREGETKPERLHRKPDISGEQG